MNKKIIISVFVTFCMLILIGGSYKIGYNKAKDLTTQEYQTKIKSMESPKGDGSHFYTEPTINNQGRVLSCTYHSTTKCSGITNGIRKDSYATDYSEYGMRRVSCFFCSKCMDDNLITKYSEKIENYYSKLGI